MIVLCTYSRGLYKLLQLMSPHLSPGQSTCDSLSLQQTPTGTHQPDVKLDTQGTNQKRETGVVSSRFHGGTCL